MKNIISIEHTTDKVALDVEACFKVP